ncbi:prephenate dehydrogenase/arogenate dehydrogenase family protein [Patescibacteria group bacterium]|nr:prephenate dehydrogenase/arogenate dehydrogenase family protein [Patescibacteria group bacterium]
MSGTPLLSIKKIGVIGYGMFGKFLCNELLKGLKVTVYSPHFRKAQTEARINFVKTLKELVKNADLIIPAVPISKFEEVIRKMLPYLKENSIVMDVCSVKSYPVQVMQKLLPKSIQKIATHPMFGPSAFNMKGKVSGLPVVMYNAGCKEEIYMEVKKYFAEIGLQVTEISPSEHDILAARSQFFSQLIRKSAQMQDIRPTFIDTPGASALFESFNLMNISDDLLIDMSNYNIYAKKVLEDTIQSLIEIRAL